jgi:hypothetical protein
LSWAASWRPPSCVSAPAGRRPPCELRTLSCSRASHQRRKSDSGRRWPASCGTESGCSTRAGARRAATEYWLQRSRPRCFHRARVLRTSLAGRERAWSSSTLGVADRPLVRSSAERCSGTSRGQPVLGTDRSYTAAAAVVGISITGRVVGSRSRSRDRSGNVVQSVSLPASDPAAGTSFGVRRVGPALAARSGRLARGQRCRRLR